MRPDADDETRAGRVASPHIGTLNERSLHAALKDWYAEEGDRFEVPVDGFVADIVRGDLIIEIQTGSTSTLRRKLATLLRRHPVRLALPVAARKTIVSRDACGEVSTARISRRRGRWIDACSELVSLREILGDPNLSVDVLLIDEEEVRAPRAHRRRHRKDWTVHDRRLIDVIDSVTFQDPADYLAFVPADLEEPFTTADLAAAIGRPRWMAQKLAYTLRHVEALRIAGKEGNAMLYRRNVPAGDSIEGGEPESVSSEA
jgi:hypothetical protein